MPAFPGVFDIRTFIFSIILIELFLSMMMILYARSRGGYPGFGTWSLQMIVMAIGQIFNALRGIIPDIVSILASNFFNTLGVLLVLEATSRFYTGKSLNRRWYLLIPVALTGIWYWFAITDLVAYRTALISLIYALIFIQVVRILFWNNDIGEKTFTRLLGLLFLGMIGVFAARLFDYLLNPMGRFFLEGSVVNTFFYLYVLIASIGAAFLFVILNFERQARELDQSHVQIQQLANRYDLAITTAGAGVWEIDLTTRHVTIDNQIIGLFGLENVTDANTNALIRERIQPDDLNRIIKSFDEISGEGVDISLEYRVQRKNGEIRNHLAHARSFLTENGTGLRLIGLSTDITPLRQAQNALSAALRKIAILSEVTRHDILNCVTVIGLTSRMLQEDTENQPNIHHHLGTIADMGEQITRFIKFTREYEGLGLYEPSWIDLVPLFSKSSFKSMLGEKNLRLPSPGVFMYVDQMVEKVFYNLIENSLRHGGDIHTISVSYRYADKDLLIIYEDDGEGILPEEKETIFNRGVGKNTGMGLFLCREILAITELSIIENGSAGSGARFEIRITPGHYRDQREKWD